MIQLDKDFGTNMYSNVYVLEHIMTAARQGFGRYHTVLSRQKKLTNPDVLERGKNRICHSGGLRFGVQMIWPFWARPVAKTA